MHQLRFAFSTLGLVQTRQRNFKMADLKRSSAAIIVIGDEILKGSTFDTNSNFLCRRLHKLGIVVKRISVVGDDVPTISNEIKALSLEVDVLFTSGGIGPTHDDKTYIGLAAAFDDKLSLNEDIASVVSLLGKEKSHNYGFISKLATIPTKAQLIWGIDRKTGERGKFPIVKIHNVVALPGVPQFCELAFNNIQDELFPPATFRPIFSEAVYAKSSEFEFSDELTKAAQHFEGDVTIGSYPVFGNSYFKTKLIVESEHPESGNAAVRDLKAMLKENVVYYDAKAWTDTVAKWEAFRQRLSTTEPEFLARLDVSMKCIEQILDQYKLEQIALSFNGGKDCTVLLHMFRVAVDKKFGPQQQIDGFHIVCEDQFPQLSQFLIDAAQLYRMTVVEVPGPLKTGVELLKGKRPQTIAVLMGSRASDPNGKYMKSCVEWTDADWPRVLRVCPILPWRYGDVWRLLRGLCVPYCRLYDEGYTSIGERSTTSPNERLRKGTSYLPAYMLQDDEAERHGRSSL